MQQCRRLTLPTSALPMAIMSDDLPDSLIPYDEIVQEALRAVVGRVLSEIESSGGLPGSHHFYNTLKTGQAGVSIPKHLAERCPDDMTCGTPKKVGAMKEKYRGFEDGLH